MSLLKNAWLWDDKGRLSWTGQAVAGSSAIGGVHISAIKFLGKISLCFLSRSAQKVTGLTCLLVFLVYFNNLKVGRSKRKENPDGSL
jgi:hypothetical protein